MKKFSLVFLALAGISFLAGVLLKLGIMPRYFLGTVPSSWIGLTQVFLLAAIAFKVCGKCCCKKDEKKPE